MRAVNLLPRELEQGRKLASTPVIVACAGVVMAGAVLAGGYLQASSSVGKKQTQLASLDAQIAAVPQPTPPPATVTGLPQERSQRVAALASALSQRVAWDRILREVSLVLPDDVWLTSLTAISPTAQAAGSTPPPGAAPTGFTINGFTYSQAAVARLLARLTVIPDLEAVTLSSASQATPSGSTQRPVVQFTIAANVRAPGATS